MSANNYANFLPKHFDSFDCLKLAPGIYAILLLVLRAYIIWIMSVTNMRDNVGFIQWVYPQTALFYLNLASGVIGLFVVLILSLRRPNASTWVKYCWKKCKTLLVLALVFDLAIGMLGYIIWQLQSLLWILMHCLLVISSIVYIIRSKRFAINIVEFPEVLPENNTRKHRNTKGLEID